jgi:hypothetical protein
MVRVYQDAREQLYAEAWTEQLPAGEGFAEAALGTSSEGQAPGAQTGQTAGSLDDMTVAELRELAQREDVDLSGLKAKQEIIDALREEGVE